MSIKKTFFVVALFFVSASAVFAQTEKGDWLVGGNLSLNTANQNTVITVAPSAGYFFLNNFAAGALVNLNYRKTGVNKSTDFAIGPVARYYFGKMENPFRPFVIGDITFGSTKLKNGGATSTVNSSNYLLGAGGAYFINGNVALETIAGYAHTKLKDIDGSGGFALNIGFQVYINRHQAATVREKLKID
jgi:outer membrane protein W